MNRTHPRPWTLRLPWVALLAVVFLVLLPLRRAQAQGLGDFVSPGKLARAHAELDGITQCGQCHVLGEGVSATACMECHDEVRDQVRTRTGFHASKGEACESCHPDHRGRDFPMVQLVEARFNHDETGFPLRGVHRDASVACEDCHEGEDWKGLDPACVACHLDEDPHRGDKSGRAFLDDCARCHPVAADWVALPLPARALDHQSVDMVDFLLHGAHVEVACKDCHDKMRFVPVASETCTDCHDNPHRMKDASSCTDCHTDLSWKVARFDHARTTWPLVDLHAQVPCKSCHGNSTVRRLPHGTCEDCHEDVHEGGFDPQPCESCHTTLGWEALVDFDHDTTDYPLVGKHKEQPCRACHAPEAPSPLPFGSCEDCHADTHEERFDPQACEDCHSPEGWQVPDFDHGLTAFDLEGAHAELACADCHDEGQLAGIPFGTCADCHGQDSPHDPQEIEAGACTDCHVVTTWAQVGFDHQARTDFPLGLPHAALGCLECHADHQRYTGLETDCEACHAEDEPLQHFDGDCGECHQAARWRPASLGAGGHDRTGFVLHGAHLDVDCGECHEDGRPYMGASPWCADCHADEDAHRHQLGDACEDCHGTDSWWITRFHHATTGWSLRGAHRLAECEDCHARSYVGTPRDCRHCHQAEAPLDIPSHLSAYFEQCETCHRAYTWALPKTLGR